jgi:hypothetical protein
MNLKITEENKPYVIGAAVGYLIGVVLSLYALILLLIAWIWLELSKNNKKAQTKTPIGNTHN